MDADPGFQARLPETGGLYGQRTRLPGPGKPSRGRGRGPPAYDMLAAASSGHSRTAPPPAPDAVTHTPPTADGTTSPPDPPTAPAPV